MNELDEMFNSVMAAGVDYNTETPSGKASFADYPDEKPSKVKLIAWLDGWHDDLIANGYPGCTQHREGPEYCCQTGPEARCWVLEHRARLGAGLVWAPRHRVTSVPVWSGIRPSGADPVRIPSPLNSKLEPLSFELARVQVYRIRCEARI